MMSEMTHDFGSFENILNDFECLDVELDNLGKQIKVTLGDFLGHVFTFYQLVYYVLQLNKKYSS